MSSYSLNPNVPQTNYSQAPTSKMPSTDRAVAKPVPATSEQESIATPKNLAIGAAALAALTMVGLGIRNRNWKFWENAVDLEKKNLENTAKSLEEQVAQQADEISALKQNDALKTSGKAERLVPPHVDDLDVPNLAKKKDGSKWSLWGRAEEKKKPPVAPPSQDLVISFDSPPKTDPSKRTWTNWFPKAKEIPIIDPTDIPQELVNQRFFYAPVNVVYKKNNAFINAPADDIAKKIQNIMTGRTIDKELRIRRTSNLDVQQAGNFILVTNKNEKVRSIVPLVDYQNVSYEQMLKLVQDGYFVMPKGNHTIKSTFSIPKGGFPHQVFYKEQGHDLAHQLPGFFAQNQAP